MRTLFLLLLSCVSCFAQFGAEQPMFAVTSQASPVPLGGLVLWLNPESSKTFTNLDGTGVVTNQSAPVRSLRDSGPMSLLFTNNGGSADTSWLWQTNMSGNTNPIIYKASTGNLLSAVTAGSTNNCYWFLVFSTTNNGNLNQVLVSGTGGYFTQISDNFSPSEFRAASPVNYSGFGVATRSRWWLLRLITTQSYAAAWTNGVFCGVTNSFANTKYGVGGGVGFGGQWPSANTPMNGDLAEVLVYGGAPGWTLSSNDIYQVETYLKRHPFPYAGP